MAISFDRLHLVEPSLEARRLLWHVLSVGVVTRDEPERREAHDKPGAFLFWVAAGRGTLQCKSGSFPLRAGPRGGRDEPHPVSARGQGVNHEARGAAVASWRSLSEQRECQDS